MMCTKSEDGLASPISRRVRAIKPCLFVSLQEKLTVGSFLRSLATIPHVEECEGHWEERKE